MSLRDRIAIVGAYATRFGERFESSYNDLLVEAALGAVGDAGLRLADVDAAWLGTYSTVTTETGESGASLADPLGIYPKPVTRIENQCVTGADAFRNAVFAVAAGACDVALVVGVEKMRDVPPRDSMVAAAVQYRHPLLGKGLTSPGVFALAATRYLHRNGLDRSILAKVAVKNHHHGRMNPRAHFRMEITEEQVLAAPMVSEPLGLFDCTPTTDGAAAVVITRRELAGRYPKQPVLLRGLGLASDMWRNRYFSEHTDYEGFAATRAAAEIAYREAGIREPLEEIDVAEVHDCFTITEILNYEDLGFAPRGEGWHLLLDGQTALGGRLPVNTSGGLKACGHPIGATGVRMIVDLVEQLRGEAGERQVGGAKLGLFHSLGGPGAVACVGILSQGE